jgi:hypothetical protein
VTPAEALLVDVTARGWLARDEALTGTVADALLEVMPQVFRPGFAAGHAPAALPFFIHQPTWLGFYLVFGERVEVGLSPAEAASLDRGQDEDGWPPPPAATPCVVADVAPFLVAERSLDRTWAERLGAWDAVKSGEPARIERALAVHGLRLPSEAELLTCWRLERLAHWPGEPSALWRGLASAVAPVEGGDGGAPLPWVEWDDGGGHVGPPCPARRARQGGSRNRPDVRPVLSLLPDAVAFSEAAVAARARLPVLRFDAG